MSNPVIIYTAIFGSPKDQLQTLPKNLGDVEFHAFLDHIEDAEDYTGWILHEPHFDGSTPRRMARKHKALSHELFPEAEITIWLDGTMTPWTKPELLINRYLNGHDICTFRHSERNCVYQEGEMCARGVKDNVPSIRRQMQLYKDELYPHHNGLAETMVVMRRHTDQVIEFNELWWSLINEYSVRDQLSFDYACWRTGLRYHRFHENYLRQQDFYFVSHWRQ